MGKPSTTQRTGHTRMTPSIHPLSGQSSPLTPHPSHANPLMPAVFISTAGPPVACDLQSLCSDHPKGSSEPGVVFSPRLMLPFVAAASLWLQIAGRHSTDHTWRPLCDCSNAMHAGSVSITASGQASYCCKWHTPA